MRHILLTLCGAILCSIDAVKPCEYKHLSKLYKIWAVRNRRYVISTSTENSRMVYNTGADCRRYLAREQRKPETAISGFQDANFDANRKLYSATSLTDFPVAINRIFMKLIFVACRWCGAGFHVCRRCWRGQVYCGEHCRRAGYLQAHRRRQRRYRQTEKGRKAHCLSENRRRHPELFPDSKNMDDGTSKSPSNKGIETTRRANASDFPPRFPARCHFCGRSGEIVDRFARRI